MTQQYPSTAVYFQRKLRKASDSEETEDLATYWRRRVVRRLRVESELKQELEAFASYHFYTNEFSKIHSEQLAEKVVAFCKDDRDLSQDDRALYVIDGLLQIIHGTHPDELLHLKFYARKLLYFVRSHGLQKFWSDFKDKEPNNPSDGNYLEGLVHFAQWFQSDEAIDLEMVEADVENIALKALENLHLKRPTHSIFNLDKTGPDCRSKKPIHSCHLMAPFLFQDAKPTQDCNWYSWREAEHLFDALNVTFYDQFEFRGNSSNYYKPSNSYIDKVLATKHGIPITLCLLYASVAKLLGLYCKPVNNPGHFLLCWEFEPPPTESGRGKLVYIDCFKRGQRGEGNANRIVPSPQQVFQRMVNNLLHGFEVNISSESNSYTTSGIYLPLAILELQLALDIDRMTTQVMLTRLYVRMHINYREVSEMLRDFDEDEGRIVRVLAGNDRFEAKQNAEREERLAEPAKLRKNFEEAHPDETFRNELGLYAVGMVMKHRRYHYHCVIYGWDEKCTAEKAWIQQMGVLMLPKQDNQPFYNVLVADGSQRYAADESLVPIKPVRISHIQVGKYFQQFDEQVGYIPVKEIQEHLYPEDMSVLNQMTWKKHRTGSSAST